MRLSDLLSLAVEACGERIRSIMAQRTSDIFFSQEFLIIKRSSIAMGGLELGKKLMLMYGLKDDLIPVWQGIELFKKTNCKIILVENGHGLFNELQNVKKAEEFLDN